MDDEIILTRPSDPRFANDNSDVPIGPPGTENEKLDLEITSRKEQVPRKSRPTSPQERQSKNNRHRSYSKGHDSPSDIRRNASNQNHKPRSPIDLHHSKDKRVNLASNREQSRSHGRFRGRTPNASPNKRGWSPISHNAVSPSNQPMLINSSDPYSMGVGNIYPEDNNYYLNQYGSQHFANFDYHPQMVPMGNYPQTYQPVPPPSIVLNHSLPTGNYNVPNWGLQQQPPPHIDICIDKEDKIKRDAAVAKEVQNQRDQLTKQRNEYLKRASALKRELRILKEQRNDLLSGSDPPSPTSNRFLSENDRLQKQIQKKLKTIENVIDMLSDIIGEKAPASPVKKPKKRKHCSDDESSPEAIKTKIIESMKIKGSTKSKNRDSSTKTGKTKQENTCLSEENKSQINYTFYDPELHWCKECNVFPKTAKDYLYHLHSQHHMNSIDTTESPWHNQFKNDEFPTYPNASVKRAPIRGLNFFHPAVAWYCKLCNFWMGDLHCASAHLKSQKHSELYTAFIEKNPHFEVDWMSERQKAYDLMLLKDIRPLSPPETTTVSTTGPDILDSIPLQLNIQKNSEVDIKIMKKKKKKIEDKKDNKRKKRSKKKKRSSSVSSSTSSSSSSDSDSEKEKKIKGDSSNSLRGASRNISKTHDKDNQTGSDRKKWITIDQPPSVKFETNSGEETIKKDVITPRWNTPQPIISDSEKKLLEELKDKLKTKSEIDSKQERNEGKDNTTLRVETKQHKRHESGFKTMEDKVKSKQNETNKKRSPEKTNELDRKRSKSHDKQDKSKQKDTGNKNNDKRSRSPDRRSRSRTRYTESRYKRSFSRGRRSYSRNRSNRGRTRRSRSRSRSRDRRNRSRGPSSPDTRTARSTRRSRSPYTRYGRRRSPSRSRSRSRSSSHHIEKPIVRYPEFRPRVPPENKKPVKTKTGDETEKKKASPKKTSVQHTAGNKKPIFIGRMPVFKKQTQNEDVKKDDETNGFKYASPMQMEYDQYDAMADYDDLMPDPMQYVSLMGAPPPPPSVPPPVSAATPQSTHYHDDGKDILPPGIDENDADGIPKPISDAPIPKKGPLPRDLQEALNIIFPGEGKPEDINSLKKNEFETSDKDNFMNIITDNINIGAQIETTSTSFNGTGEISQEGFIGFSSVNYTEHPTENLGIPLTINTTPPPPPPPPPSIPNEVSKSISKTTKEDDYKISKDETSNWASEEMDDLTMLGIDANDMAAQCMQ